MSGPLVRFVVAGAQKAGTSALADYLRLHPAIRLPASKEAHVFDDPALGADATRGEVEGRYAAHFPAPVDGCLHGDATPAYLFLPAAVERIARYNPAMRWLVLLRDPAERAVSHYHMERRRGTERWPLAAALLLERWRLRGHRDDLGWESPLRIHSYLSRGDYARQFDVLFSHFPREQVLVLQSRSLREAPVPCLESACRFLGIPPLEPPPAPREVFRGDYPPSRAATGLARWLLRRERADLRARYGISFPP